MGIAGVRDKVSRDRVSAEARARGHRLYWWIASFWLSQQRKWQNSQERRMLTIQKHPGATGMQRKLMDILTIRSSQGPILLPRGRQERVWGFLYSKQSVGSGASWGNCRQDIYIQMKVGTRYQDIPMETTKIEPRRNNAGFIRMTQT